MFWVVCFEPFTHTHKHIHECAPTNIHQCENSRLLIRCTVWVWYYRSYVLGGVFRAHCRRSAGDVDPHVLLFALVLVRGHDGYFGLARCRHGPRVVTTQCTHAAPAHTTQRLVHLPQTLIHMHTVLQTQLGLVGKSHSCLGRGGVQLAQGS